MRASDCLGTAVGPLAITHPFNDLLLHFIPHYGLLFFFGGGATPCGLWDLSSLDREQTLAPTVEVWSLNHWTAREFPHYRLL